MHLAFPPDTAFATAELVTELGGTVAGLTVGHPDTTHSEALAAFTPHPARRCRSPRGSHSNSSTCWRKQRPDLFAGSPELAALAAAAGIPAVGVTAAALVGWRGAARLAERARAALRNPSFVHRLAAPPPYAAGWLRRSADWHVKQEVR